MFGFLKKSEPIEKFWKWFVANEKGLRDFEKNPDKTLTTIIDNIKKIQNGFAIELEPQKNGIINLTISADGDKDLFQTVENIIAQAPKINGWVFIAFRQRMPIDKVKGMTLKAKGYELNPEEMKFFPMISGDSLKLIIYVNGINDENYNQIAYNGLMLIDNILGEYDCVTKVNGYDFHIMPIKLEELRELKPLLKLANFVDNFYKLKLNQLEE